MAELMKIEGKEKFSQAHGYFLSISYEDGKITDSWGGDAHSETEASCIART